MKLFLFNYRGGDLPESVYFNHLERYPGEDKDVPVREFSDLYSLREFIKSQCKESLMLKYDSDNDVWFAFVDALYGTYRQC